MKWFITLYYNVLTYEHQKAIYIIQANKEIPKESILEDGNQTLVLFYCIMLIYNTIQLLNVIIT